MPSSSEVVDENLRSTLNILVIELFSFVAENECKIIKQHQSDKIRLAKKELIKKKIRIRVKEIYIVNNIIKKYGISKYLFYRIKNESS